MVFLLSLLRYSQISDRCSAILSSGFFHPPLESDPDASMRNPRETPLPAIPATTVDIHGKTIFYG
jgi:hypothetical protein